MILLIIYHHPETFKDPKKTEILLHKYCISNWQARQIKTEFSKKNKKNYQLKWKIYETK
jgi:hypothetical protein